jgi:hypothetical protein
MSTFGDCVKRDVCIYAKEDICNDCGHYISDRKFTSTNTRITEIADAIQEACSDFQVRAIIGKRIDKLVSQLRNAS